jgi:hypothetical protein
VLFQRARSAGDGECRLQDFVTIENNQLVYGDYSATNHTQFFITDAQPRFLDFQAHDLWPAHPWMGAPGQLVAVPRDTADKPTAPVTITAATIEPNNHDAVLVLAATDAWRSLITVTVTDAKGAVSTKSFNATASTMSSTRVRFGESRRRTTGKDRPFRVGASRSIWSSTTSSAISSCLALPAPARSCSRA